MCPWVWAPRVASWSLWGIVGRGALLWGAGPLGNRVGPSTLRATSHASLRSAGPMGHVTLVGASQGPGTRQLGGGGHVPPPGSCHKLPWQLAPYLPAMCTSCCLLIHDILKQSQSGHSGHGHGPRQLSLADTPIFWGPSPLLPPSS